MELLPISSGSARTGHRCCSGWRRNFAPSCTNPLTQPPSPPPQQRAHPPYLLVEPKAQRHSLAPLLVVAFGAMEVFAEFGERHAGFPVRVEHVGWGQHYEGVCNWTWDGTRGGDGSDFPLRWVCLLPGAAGSPENRQYDLQRRHQDSCLPPWHLGRGRAPLPILGSGEWGCGSAPRAQQAARGGAGRPGHPPQSQPSISSCRSRSCLLQ